MRVGLFDSGVGGLTVLKTLIEKYPCNEYIYYGDTLNIPYGNKNKDELLKLSRNNINFLISKNVDIIIIACGTVSSNCLNELKKEYDIPILSIIEPTLEFLNKSDYKNIGVIATNATINSHIFSENVKKNVYEIATPKLVPLIENNELTNINDILHEYLDRYRDIIDVLVLGCTHYPIIKKDIHNVIGDDVVIIDMSKLITLSNNGKQNVKIYFSKINDIIIDNTVRIIGNSSYIFPTCK